MEEAKNKGSVSTPPQIESQNLANISGSNPTNATTMGAVTETTLKSSDKSNDPSAVVANPPVEASVVKDAETNPNPRATNEEAKHDPGNDRVTIDDPPAVPLARKTEQPTLPAPREQKTEMERERKQTASGEVPSAEPVKASPSQATTTVAPVGGNPSNQQNMPQAQPVDGNQQRQQQPLNDGSQRLALPPSDPQEVALGAVRRERLPLTEPYHPYICPCDTSLQDARRRLETALEQTRRLRQAFTERVYGKYRVCLKPPPTLPEMVIPIRQDPDGSLAKLQQEMERVRTEKELEKRDTSNLNLEVSKSKSSNAHLNIDHADQLMFMSCGLNLVILPEDTTADPEMLKNYTDGRGPTLESGQRNRSISHAASTAGEVILDRTRKAASLRIERLKKTNIQPPYSEQIVAAAGSAHLAGSMHPFDASAVGQPKGPINAAAAPVLVQPTMPMPAAQVKPAPALTIRAPPKSSPTPTPKQGRSRGSSILSANSLLSLHPLAEQLDGNKIERAATAALITRGVGNFVPTAKSSTQWRLRHPHPESLGGRRRGGSTPTSSQFSQELLKQTLPPLPAAARERTERKPLPVRSPVEATTPRAKKAIQAVLEPFSGAESRNVSKANIMHHLSKSSAITSVGMKKEKINTTVLSQEPPVESALDPMVAFLVLQAIGLLGPSETAGSSKPLEERFEGVPSFGSRKLEQLRGTILSGKSNSMSRRFMEDCTGTKKRPSASIEVEQPPTKRGNHSASAPVAGSRPGSHQHPNVARDEIPVESIRGGGDAGEPTDPHRPGGHIAQPTRPNNRTNAGARDDRNGVAWPPNQQHPSIHSATQQAGSGFMDLSRPSVAAPGLPGYLAPPDRYHAASGLNTLQLAHQLQTNTFRPTGGDYNPNNVGYPAGVPPRQEQYTMEPFGAHSSMSFGMSRRNQAVAEAQAHAMFAREQQAAAAAAMMHRPPAGYQQTGGQHYPPMNGAQPSSAVASLMGNPNNQFIAHGQYGMNTVQAPVNAQFQQPRYQPQVPKARETESSIDRVSTADRNEPEGAQRTEETQSKSTAQIGRREQQPESKTQQDASSTAPARPAASVGKTQVIKGPQSETHVSAPRHEAPKNQTQVKAPVAALPKKSLHEAPNSQTQPIASSKAQNSQATKSSTAALPKADVKNETFSGPRPPTASTTTKASQPGASETKVVPKRNPTVQISGNQAAGMAAKVTVVAEKQVALQGKETVPDNKPAEAVLPVGTLVKPAHPVSVKESVAPDKRLKQLGAETKTVGAPTASSNPAEVGLKFVAPSRSDLLEDEYVHEILQGKFNSVIQDLNDMEKKKAALQHLSLVAAAVPIPKALVANALREAMSPPGFKNLGASTVATIPREPVVSAILVWLWAQHESVFQSAFHRSGRIDVDQDCKWLIQAAVDMSVKEIAKGIASERTGGGTYTDFAIEKKIQAAHKSDGAPDPAANPVLPNLQLKAEIHSAVLASTALLAEFSTKTECDSVLPEIQNYIEYLDEARVVALQAKAQERSLLANLIARKAMMTDSFSHAYVSSIVRAGEAIGHGKLFEVVQNEDIETSTMIPYDVFTDESNEWEDPCKPEQGMSLGLSADGLSRRAHARAMIQKSLRKLQDKHNVKGGTVSAGPYADASSSASGPGGKPLPASSPRPGVKRKHSITEPPAPPGTGSARAPNWNVFNPRHFTEALEWNTSVQENSPYGRHRISNRPRSVSLAARDSKKFKKQKLPDSVAPTVSETSTELDDALARSTIEIQWGDIADIFQHVELPKKAPSRASSSHHESAPMPADGKIFAPFCRKVGPLADNPDDSDNDEDTSEELVVREHQKVLDEMKQKLSAYMDARRRQQERRRSRKSRS